MPLKFFPLLVMKSRGISKRDTKLTRFTTQTLLPDEYKEH